MVSKNSIIFLRFGNRKKCNETFTWNESESRDTDGYRGRKSERQISRVLSILHYKAAVPFKLPRGCEALTLCGILSISRRSLFGSGLLSIGHRNSVLPANRRIGSFQTSSFSFENAGAPSTYSI